jgi:[CysO sulfur-carrier protein]-S-L-cysteine hydrolase
MRVFDIEVSESLLRAMREHAERDYPNEACGLGFLTQDEESLARVVPMRNMQDRYHARDPQAFPRTARDAFRLDELERMRVLEEADTSGLVEGMVYHSHCDAGAYFSAEDRAMVVRDGIELLPGFVHVVISVRDGRAQDAAAFRYVPETGGFEEMRLPPAAGVKLEGLPDLHERAMVTRGDGCLLPPVGGELLPRVVSSEEAERLVVEAGALSLKVDAQTKVHLSRFGRGLYSPLEGFLRVQDVRSVVNKGRLLSGRSWRTPITLSVSPSQAQGIDSASFLVLKDMDATPLAVLAVDERTEQGGHVFLSGPVFVMPNRDASLSALDHRAEWVRRGAQKIVAVPKLLLASAWSDALDTFDIVLTELGCPETSGTVERVLESSDDFWLFAAMAQNMGATHLAVPHHGDEASFRDTLDLAFVHLN